MRMKPGAPVGGGGAAHADVDRLRGAGLGLYPAPVPVAGAGAQVVQMAHRDRGQTREARIAKYLKLAAQYAGRSRARKRVHRPVDLHQQRYVQRRIASRERMLRRAVALGQLLAADPPSHQARDLCPAVAA